MGTFFLLRGFIFHSPVGLNPPPTPSQEERAHAEKQAEMDRQERAEEGN